MADHTREWEEKHPDGTEAASLGDDRIVNLKVDLGERLEDLLYGFNISDGTGDEATPGVKVLNFKEQASLATPSENQINIASKVGSDGDAKAQLWAKDEDGNERQLTKTSGGALRLNVKAGDYAADSIDQDDIRLANNAYLTGRNQANTADVNIVKVNTSNEIELGAVTKLPDTSKLATSGAPTADAQLANKKYVDDTYLAGQAVQVVNTQTGAVATGAVIMPYDDTIPQQTEGNEFMTLAITPKSATNKLKIDVVLFGTPSDVNRHNIVALFKDSDANAIAVGQTMYCEHIDNVKFTHFMVAGGTDEITFKVRAGFEIAGTYTFNGKSGVRKFGGKLASSITITEIKV